jgi:hypothetical protein
MMDVGLTKVEREEATDLMQRLLDLVEDGDLAADGLGVAQPTGRVNEQQSGRPAKYQRAALWSCENQQGSPGNYLLVKSALPIS